MSGGSGCQQIKLFVFRPGFGTLSLHSASASLPVTLCLSLYLPLSVPFSLFFSPCLFFFFLCYRPTTCTASAELLFSLFPSLSSPSLPLLLYSVCMRTMRLVFADEACLSMCACVFMMMLVFANEASGILCVCLYLLVVRGAA